MQILFHSYLPSFMSCYRAICDLQNSVASRVCTFCISFNFIRLLTLPIPCSHLQYSAFSSLQSPTVTVKKLLSYVLVMILDNPE